MSATGATEVAPLIGAISRLAWPVAVITLVLAFRRPIAEQVGRMRVFKAGGAEVTFAERVDDALRASAKIAKQVADEVSAARRAQLLQLASVNAREAVPQGWTVVREAAQGAARRRQLTWSTTKDFIEYMEHEGTVDSSTVRLVLDLRSLRYDMADDPQQDVTSTTATAYVTAATSVADLLSAMAST